MGKKGADSMPFEIDFTGLDYPIIITIKGVLTINEFVEILAVIINSEDYPANIDAIYDLTQMSFDNITSDFLQSLDYCVQRDDNDRAGAKTAYVCPKELQFGMIRAWEAFIDDLPVKTLVTRSMDEAVRWIKSEPTRA